MKTKVPAKLAEMTDLDAVKALEAELIAEFDEQHDGERDLAEMKKIAEATKAVREQKAKLEKQAADDQAEIDALAAEMRPEASDDAPEGDDDEEDDEDEGEDAEGADAEGADENEGGDGGESADATGADSADEQEKELAVTAAGGKRKSKAPSAKRTRSAAPPPAIPDRRGADIVITAAADVPGYANSQTLTRKDVAVAMHARARGLADKSPRATVATVTTGLPEDLIVSDTNDALAALDRAMEVANPTGQRNAAESLVAAGGWCTPSTYLFDQFSLESRDGIFRLPTIGVPVNRGGVQIPSFFTVGDAASALWTWSETTDINRTGSVTNKARTSNVTTLTTATAHGLAVGQTVTVTGTGTTDMDGTFVVTGVPTSTTFTYANTGANVASTAAAGAYAIVKGCLRIPCPTWTNYRLGAEGVCLTHGNLQDRSYPELTTRFVDLTMTAHLHRVGNAQLAAVLTGATGVTVTAIPSDAAGELLNAIELEATAFREQYLMSENAVLEAVFPMWARGPLRTCMAVRNGVAAMNVTNAEITSWFTSRGIAPQFVYGYQSLGTNPTAWPATMKFAFWAAGAYVAGDGGTIDLGVQRDSRLNEANDFTAAWSEQFFLVARRGPVSREITVTIPETGVTGGLAAGAV